MLGRAANLPATMSRYLSDRIAGTPNIEVITGVEVEEGSGAGGLESVTVKAVATGERSTIPASALFIFIGVKPHTEAFAGILERDPAGFLLTRADLPPEHGRA